MKSVGITKKRCCKIIEKKMPLVKDNFALIKVMVAPMCNEYVAYRDYTFNIENKPESLGHEIAGEIVKIENTRLFKPGDRVVGIYDPVCGYCEFCKNGYYSNCLNRLDYSSLCDGESGDCGFAQYVILPDTMLLPIPDNLSYEHASMACCGLGPTFSASEILNVSACDTVLITGIGPVGLGGVIIAKARGAFVIAVGRHPYRIELAKKLGADFVINPEEGDPLIQLMDLTNNRGVNYAMDCSGFNEYQQFALDALRPRGKIVFLAETDVLELNVTKHLMAKGITIYGTLIPNKHFNSKLLDLISTVKDKLDIFITHSYSLKNIKEAWEKQITKECGKIILYPWKD